MKPPFGEEFLDVAIAQGEAQVDPDHVSDDHGENGGGNRRFRPSRQPILGLASELSGYPDKATPDEIGRHRLRLGFLSANAVWERSFRHSHPGMMVAIALT